MDIKKHKEGVSLRLSNDEALVFFEWVSNFNKDDNKTTITNTAEKQLFWDIEACLERNLIATFKTNYNTLLEKARNNIIGKKDK